MGSSNFFLIGNETLVFFSSKYWGEKNCYNSQFNSESLFCCAIMNYIKCYRINLYTFKVIKEFSLTKIGYNMELNNLFINFLIGFKWF